MAKRPKKPKAETVSRQGVKTPAELEAYVWVLKTDGLSYREIEKEAGVSLATVQRILAKDPDRLETLVRAGREERARIYQRLENSTLKSLERFLHHVDDVLFPKGLPRKKKLTAAEKDILQVGRPWAAVMRLAADSATRHVQGLMGGPGGDQAGQNQGGRSPTGEVEDEIPEVEQIRQAIELGIVEILPAAMREKARAMMELEGDDSDTPFEEPPDTGTGGS